MNLDDRKKLLVKALDEMENEIAILVERINKVKSALPDIQTQEDMERFCEENDLEEGFEHLEIF